MKKNIIIYLFIISVLFGVLRTLEHPFKDVTIYGPGGTVARTKVTIDGVNSPVRNILVSYNVRTVFVNSVKTLVWEVRSLDSLRTNPFPDYPGGVGRTITMQGVIATDTLRFKLWDPETEIIYSTADSLMAMLGGTYGYPVPLTINFTMRDYTVSGTVFESIEPEIKLPNLPLMVYETALRPYSYQLFKHEIYNELLVFPTNAQGKYQIPGITQGTRITFGPESEHYYFFTNPQLTNNNIPLTMVISNNIQQNFYGVPKQLVKVSGVIYYDDPEFYLPNIPIDFRINGNPTETILTDNLGAYQLFFYEKTSPLIIPRHEFWVFNAVQYPDSASVTFPLIELPNKQLDFIATPKFPAPFSVTGHITVNALPLVVETVDYETRMSGSGSVSTNTLGFFQIPNIVYGDFIHIIPQKTGWEFASIQNPTQNYIYIPSVNPTNCENNDFTATIINYQVYGAIRDHLTNALISNIPIHIDRVIIDPNPTGNYSFTRDYGSRLTFYPFAFDYNFFDPISLQRKDYITIEFLEHDEEHNFSALEADKFSVLINIYRIDTIPVLINDVYLECYMELGGTGTWLPYYSQNSSASNLFSLKEANNYIFYAEKEGYTFQTYSDNPYPGSITNLNAPTTINLFAEAQRFQICGNTGTPGASIYLLLNPEEKRFLGYSDENGDFCFPNGLIYGEILELIIAEKDGWIITLHEPLPEPPGTFPYIITDNITGILFDAERIQYTITVKVVEHDQTPIPGVNVQYSGVINNSGLAPFTNNAGETSFIAYWDEIHQVRVAKRRTIFPATENPKITNKVNQDTTLVFMAKQKEEFELLINTTIDDPTHPQFPILGGINITIHNTEAPPFTSLTDLHTGFLPPVTVLEADSLYIYPQTIPGYSFTPATILIDSVSVANVNNFSNQSINITFAATIAKYTISGNAGVEGVNIYLLLPSTERILLGQSIVNGDFEFANIVRYGDVIMDIIAEKPGYTFSKILPLPNPPGTFPYTVQANISNLRFSAFRQPYTITVSVVEYDQTTPIAGVKVYYQGIPANNGQAPNTNALGQTSFIAYWDEIHSISVMKRRTIFTSYETPKLTNKVRQDTTIVFIAKQKDEFDLIIATQIADIDHPQYPILGNVGITIKNTSAAPITNNTSSQTGILPSVRVLEADSLYIFPQSVTGYTFNPQYVLIDSVCTSNIRGHINNNLLLKDTGQLIFPQANGEFSSPPSRLLEEINIVFIASSIPYTVSGKVVDEYNVGTAGIAIHKEEVSRYNTPQPHNTIFTNTLGEFSFSTYYGSEIRVYPENIMYDFQPMEYHDLQVVASTTDLIFQIAMKQYKVSGIVQTTLQPLANVEILLLKNGVLSATTWTSALPESFGSFYFHVNYGDNISLQAQKTGYSFTPSAPGYILTNINTDISDLNFVAIETGITTAPIFLYQGGSQTASENLSVAYYNSLEMQIFADLDAEIYFTTNPSEMIGDWTLYESPFIIDSNTILKAYAQKPNYTPSGITAAGYEIIHQLSLNDYWPSDVYFNLNTDLEINFRNYLDDTIIGNHLYYLPKIKNEMGNEAKISHYYNADGNLFVQFIPEQNWFGSESFDFQIQYLPQVLFTDQRSMESVCQGSFQVHINPNVFPIIINYVSPENPEIVVNTQDNQNNELVFFVNASSANTLYYRWEVTPVPGDPIPQTQEQSSVFTYRFNIPSHYLVSVQVYNTLDGQEDGDIAYSEIIIWNVYATVSQKEEPDEINLPEVIGNYPNPFNPRTKIFFHLEHDSFVNLTIYNIKGQIIDTLVNTHVSSGKYTLLWDGHEQSSGIYFLVFKTNDFTTATRMLLLK